MPSFSEKSIAKLATCDPRLQRVFVNLLTNACEAFDGCKRSPRHIDVTVAVAGPKIVFEVHNNGASIPEDIRERLFEPFFTTKGPSVGTGLGLSISYGIVSEHGGTIRHSTPPDGGACFVVSLPVDAATPLGQEDSP